MSVKEAFCPALIALLASSLARCTMTSHRETGDNSVPPDSTRQLEELVRGLEWSEWYREKSGYVPSPDHFGSYVTLAVARDLYIGLGAGLPTLGDGALIARHGDRESLELVGVLAEEGVHEMLWDDQTGILHIAGTDPSWPQDWSAGNHYVYLPSTKEPIRKYRDPQRGLVNVIHTWGLWRSPEHMLYAAVSSHDGSFTRDRNLLRRIYDRINWLLDEAYFSTDYGVTRMGQIFRTPDNGQTWEHLADVGDFRAYDVIGFNHRLYALYADTPESACRLAAAEDGGRKWNDVSQTKLQRTHLIPFQRVLVAVSAEGQSLQVLSEDSLSRRRLPEGFKVVSYFNVLAVAEPYLYVLCSREDTGASAILRTRDLNEWEQVISTERKLISLAFWPARDCLVVGSGGEKAGLWQISLRQVESEASPVLSGRPDS